MPQSLAQIWLHVVFSTKERCTFFEDKNFRLEMFRMLSYHVQQCGCVSGRVGGHIDHVHLLIGLSRTITVSALAEQIKMETSKWAKSSSAKASLFCWQAGYGVFSVSHSNRDEVAAYIRDQDEHHTKMSFKDEFRKLCERHAIALDERYAWE